MTTPLNSDPVPSCYAEVIPGILYIGDCRAAQNLELLKQLGITHILNSSPRIDCFFPGRFTYCHLRIEDNLPGLTAYLPNSNAFIELGKTVLVHCRKGVSRSAALVIAYLMKTRQLGYEEAMDVVKQAWPAADPCLYFRLELRGYELSLKYTASPMLLGERE